MSRDRVTVSAAPTKDFFVKMLVRDIDLTDAVLDLLDNCIDGAIRLTKEKMGDSNRYKGFYAMLDFSGGTFSIIDNCGGISPELADHAFMMGRPDLEKDSDIPTVGMYGIGMKRALFKMGRSSRVRSQTEEESFCVSITPDWLDNISDWDLPYEKIKPPFAENGTQIQVDALYEGVEQEFSGSSSADFLDTLRKAISTHYCFIAQMGFEFFLNNEKIEPVPLTLLFDEGTSAINPYLYCGDFGDVQVTLAVGFLGQAPTEDEIDREQDQRRRSEDAGWTIICNDRVILYKDKSKMTGWGVGTVPSYHTQFITVSGVVEFRSNHAEHLPVTTTKRGVDASSDLYLRTKDFMMEGMKLFTHHTNIWKKHKEEETKMFATAATMNVRDIPTLVPAPSWKQVRGHDNERKFVPPLPRPSTTDPFRQVRFSRRVVDIRKVADYLFENVDTLPSDVGGACFDEILKIAREEN